MEASIWGAYRITKWLSSSLRFRFALEGKIDGMDTEIIAPVQTANPEFQGGYRNDVLLGFNAIGQNGFVKNQRLAIEFGLPIVQDLNGPQLKTASTVMIGWQYAL